MIDQRQPNGELGPGEEGGAATEQLSEAEIQRILRTRAEALARPLGDDTTADETSDVLVFRLGSERYGVETGSVSAVASLRELTPVPGTPLVIRGVFLHRGRVLPVLDLNPLFGQTKDSEGDDAVIVVEAGGMTFGIAATEVVGIRGAHVQQLAPVLGASSDQRSALIRGVTDDLVGILDLPALARDPRVRVEDQT